MSCGAVVSRADCGYRIGLLLAAKPPLGLRKDRLHFPLTDNRSAKNDRPKGLAFYKSEELFGG